MSYHAYANGQNEWGNGVGGVNGGLFATSYYSATFTKENNNDVLHTRISNTGLNIRDYLSSDESSVGFEFHISLTPGEIGSIEDSTSLGSLTDVFSESIFMKGQRDQSLGTLNNPDAGPFTLTKDGDTFTGTYSENAQGVDIIGANYELNTTNIEISLDDFDVGDTFSVLWQGSTLGISNIIEGTVDAHFWDPINGSGDRDPFFNIGPSTSPVPVPGTVWLFGTGLVGLIGAGSKRSRKGKA